MDRLKVGDVVRTLKDTSPTGYQGLARQYNQWGVKGIVMQISDQHGLCYGVLHYGVMGWYEPDELVPSALPSS